MKGIMIYEAPFWGDEENAVYTHEVTNASYKLSQVGSDDITCYLEGIATKDPITKAKCNKDDTYDFETGALISLMKMCGKEKALKAVEELYSLKEPRGADLDGDVLESKVEYLAKENESLKVVVKSLKASICAKRVLNAKLLKDYNSAQSAYEVMVEKSADLMDQVKKLEEENETLKKRANELEVYNNQLEDRVAAEQRGGYKFLKDMEKLQEENERLKREVKTVRDALNAWKHKYQEVIAKNKELKLDCEKLQHGYNDMIFCGGRQNGKQFTFLVELFKKLPQDEVEAAYKKAYHTTLPAWQKEFLNSLYGLRSWPKIPEIPVSKREKMWDDILKEGRTPIWVKREDIHDFLKECERTGIKWSSGKSPLETMPFYMTDGCEGAYFFVMTSIDISKSKPGIQYLRHVMTWWTTACPEEVEGAIHYIRPMRWDLFEKGRIAVKVSKENHTEFCGKILDHFTKVRISAFNHACKYGYFVFNKDTSYVDRIFVSNNGDVKEINRRKVVDWEDVR